MSDQPKPATGEWSEPKLEDGVVRVYCDNKIMFTMGEQYRSTADAIRRSVNAAIAAAYEKGHDDGYSKASIKKYQKRLKDFARLATDKAVLPR